MSPIYVDLNFNEVVKTFRNEFLCEVFLQISKPIILTTYNFCILQTAGKKRKMVYHPPGGPAQIVFSFDTTGSMSSILDEVRGRLTDMIGRLQADIPGIQIAVFAHGDYCDEREFYVTKHIDFTDNVNDLLQFVSDVGGTGGGDTDECYELVLRQVQGLSWQENSQKSLVLIGDAGPHAPDYPLNVDNINWQQETQSLAAKVSRFPNC